VSASYQKSLVLISLSSLVVTSLFIAPGIAFDPFNVSRLLSIGAFSGASLVALTLGLKYQWVILYKSPLIAVTVFIFCLTLTLFLTDPPLMQQFYGAFGRNTGYLAYFGLTIQLLISVISASPKNLNAFVMTLISVSIVSSTYGYLQTFQLDPFQLDNPTYAAIGIFGNQNFQSAFTAIAIVAAFAIFVSQNIHLKNKILLGIFIVFSLLQLFFTVSSQGFLLVIGSSGLVIYLRYIRNLKIQWISAYLTTGVIGIVLLLQGVLNKGYLAKYLYQESVTFRGDYWRAAQKMAVENPFLGVGLDSYGDWYRRARSLEATLRRGPDSFSNSAHNLFLDLASNGGLFLLIAYLVLFGLTIRASVKVIHREKSYDWKFVAIFVSWFTYFVQSVISINQLGLGIWGWTFSGLLIGYEINTRETKESLTKIKPDSDILLFSLFGFILGVLVAVTPFRDSVELRSLSGGATVSAVESFGMRNSLNPEVSVLIAGNLEKNKLSENALKIIRNTVKRYPDSYAAWKTLSMLKSATPKEIAQAQIQMKRLDPLNPELK
jgi:O-antigen ligase